MDSLNIFSSDECLERRDSIDSGICLKADGGWFYYLCLYVISFGLAKSLVGSIRKIEGDIEIVDDL